MSFKECSAISGLINIWETFFECWFEDAPPLFSWTIISVPDNVLYMFQIKVFIGTLFEMINVRKTLFQHYMKTLKHH